MPADDLRVDLGAGEEGQQDGAEAGEEVDPLGEREADRVAGDRADHDLDKRHRDRDPDRDDRGEQARPSHNADASQTLSTAHSSSWPWAAVRGRVAARKKPASGGDFTA